MTPIRQRIGPSLRTIAGEGRVRWRREVARNREGMLREPNNPAAPSPVTDGKNVYVFFQDFGMLAYGPAPS